MKQLLQDARSGEVSVAEVTAPQLLPGCLLVRTVASLVSAGTERALTEFARKNIFEKAKARPDLVRNVLTKLHRDGLTATVAAVRSRLDQPQSVGYSSAGIVVEVADGVCDINVGDRVACAGAGYAVHAEYACVPRLLAAKIPAIDEASAEVNRRKASRQNLALRPVSYEEAAFGTVGAICLHGLRTADVSLGDTVAVIGLGLLGQITVQLLKAAGCRVLGMDPMRERADLATRSGAEAVTTSSHDLRDLCFQMTGGKGVDSVLITAETPSSDPVNLAAEVARDRAIVCAVGTVGMELERKLYFEKELIFRVSRSYGPGRYDAAYEQKGRDYPIGYVRWTETRNMEVFLRFISESKLDLPLLVTHRFSIDQAQRAYDLVTGRAEEPSLGILLTYSAADGDATEHSFDGPVLCRSDAIPQKKTSIGVAVLGAGNFAQTVLLPALKAIPEVSFVGVCNASGARSGKAAEKFRFSYCARSANEILSDPTVDAVLIATPHNLHATQTLAALKAGKSVFCEKPLCLTENELAEIVRAISPASFPKHPPQLMVGFNRRFAPMALALKKFVSEIREPLSFHYRINAGFISADHWINDPEQGGGRVLGEMCHFVDFLCFLTGACPTEVRAESVGNAGQYSMDNVIAQLKFANGTLGTISYLAHGDRSASKERIEVMGGGSVAILEDFRRLELIRNGRKRVTRSWFYQDKGHKTEMRAFVDAVLRRVPLPVSFEDIVGATLATLRLYKACQTGQVMQVDRDEFIASALRREAGEQEHAG